MKIVTNGACPLQVIRVISWYWIVWIPLWISSFQSAFRYLLDDLIIKRLTASLTFLDYLVADLLAADVYKRSQMGEREGLSAVLIAGYLCDDLCGNVTCGKEAVRLLNQCLADNRAVLEHILQIDQVTVMLTLCVVIGIMEMNDSCREPLRSPQEEEHAWSGPC